MMHNFLLGAATFFATVYCINTQYEHFQKRSDSDYLGVYNSPSNFKEYSEYPDYENKAHQSSRDLGWGSPSMQALGQLTPASHAERNSQDTERNFENSKLKLLPEWPDSSKQLGQLSAVSIDTNGNVVVFHRGDRIWGSQTFRFDNVYAERDRGPIPQNTVVVFNASTGQVVDEWGSNRFYLPHGLTVDSENNIWVTDVALHQVFKFPAKRDSTTQPSLSLGMPFIPGNDDIHFCKPTDVAIMSNGDFFVSDGYCNNRILKFDKNGKKLMVWGRSTFQGILSEKKPAPYHFFVPHALALAEEKELLFVADRENGRIQCFNTSTGVFIMQLQSHIMGTRIFSVAYTPTKGGLLYVVNGPGLSGPTVQVGGFVISLATQKLVAHFNSDGPGMQNPHDVAVTADGSQVYVVELKPFKVWKFIPDNGNLTSPVKVKSEETHSSANSSIPDSKLAASYQSGINLSSGTKLDAHKFEAQLVGVNPVHYRSVSPAATVVIIILAVVVVVVIMFVIAVIRMRRGWSRYRKLSMENEKFIDD